MTAAPIESTRFDMGRVVGRTFSAVGANFVTFYLLGLMLVGAPLFLMQYGALGALSSAGTLDYASNPSAMFGPTYFIGLLLYLIGGFILQAAFTHGAFAHFNGQRAALGDLVATGARFFLVTLAIAILAALGMALGFLLLFVPGLILMTLWAVAVPAAVVERVGAFGALGRSRALTRNHRWAIFGLLVAMGILTYIITLLAQVIASAFAGAASVTPMAGMAVASALISPVAAIIGAASVSAIYFELRSVKEGIGPEQLASVFD